MNESGGYSESFLLLIDYNINMRFLEKYFGVEGDIDDGIKQDLYENVDADIEYSPERAIRTAKNSSVYANFDDQGAVTLDSGFLMDTSSQNALKEVFGDMLFGDDRKNRTSPKMIQTEDELSYQEIGAATIGAGLAAAKVDEAGNTPYKPAYGQLFATVIEGNWNMNPDVIGDFNDDQERYEDIVQQTAESVEEDLLEIRPEPGADIIDEELDREERDIGDELDREERDVEKELE
jgi:hypothetical protein